MGTKQIRVGQLIAPFGPGSIYTDRYGTPHVICGLDYWYKKVDPIDGIVDCDKPAEFERFESRLAALLRVNRFKIPPDYRFFRARNAQDSPPPNAMLYVPALRFPRWYRHTKTGEMKRFNLHTAIIDRPTGGGRWQPVRFISVCDAGHLCEFPWQEWIGCTCQTPSLVLTDRGGSELSSIRIECKSCPDGTLGRKGKSLAQTTVRPDEGDKSAFEEAGIACPGERPWLGEGAEQVGCARPLIGALINQTNLYFPKTISAIALPDVSNLNDEQADLRVAIEEDQTALGIAKTTWAMGERALSVAMVRAKLDARGIRATDSDIEVALESIFDAPLGRTSDISPAQPEPDLLKFRRAEYNMLRREVNDPKKIPNLRVTPTIVSPELKDWICRVNLVERLQETRVFYGFDRIQQSSTPLAGLPQVAMSQLFRNPPTRPHEMWLPAIEVFGEGIFIELDSAALANWQTTNAKFIERRISHAFRSRIQEVPQILPPLTGITLEWASRYLVVHTLAHIIINQLVFECGYSTASLRERLFVSSDTAAPMSALMIYTAAGDSEGTLGGLVRLGYPERLTEVIQRAVARAAWCSADPVCSENLGGQGSRLANLAACHACVLLPETSCETINQVLDRGMVVGTPKDSGAGYLGALLQSTPQYS